MLPVNNRWASNRMRNVALQECHVKRETTDATTPQTVCAVGWRCGQVSEGVDQLRARNIYGHRLLIRRSAHRPNHQELRSLHVNELDYGFPIDHVVRALIDPLVLNLRLTNVVAVIKIAIAGPAGLARCFSNKTITTCYLFTPIHSSLQSN